jgi:hypothetical protein
MPKEESDDIYVVPEEIQRNPVQSTWIRRVLDLVDHDAEPETDEQGSDWTVQEAISLATRELYNAHTDIVQLLSNEEMLDILTIFDSLEVECRKSRAAAFTIRKALGKLVRANWRISHQFKHGGAKTLVEAYECLRERAPESPRREEDRRRAESAVDGLNEDQYDALLNIADQEGAFGPSIIGRSAHTDKKWIEQFCALEFVEEIKGKGTFRYKRGELARMGASIAIARRMTKR